MNAKSFQHGEPWVEKKTDNMKTLKLIGKFLLVLLIKVVLFPLELTAFIFKVFGKLFTIINNTIKHFIKLVETEVF